MKYSSYHPENLCNAFELLKSPFQENGGLSSNPHQSLSKRSLILKSSFVHQPVSDLGHIELIPSLLSILLPVTILETLVDYSELIPERDSKTPSLIYLR